MSDSLCGSSVYPSLAPTEIISIEPASHIVWGLDASDGITSGGLETVASWAGLNTLLEEKCLAMWVFRNPRLVLSHFRLSVRSGVPCPDFFCVSVCK